MRVKSIDLVRYLYVYECKKFKINKLNELFYYKKQIARLAWDINKLALTYSTNHIYEDTTVLVLGHSAMYTYTGQSDAM